MKNRSQLFGCDRFYITVFRMNILLRMQLHYETGAVVIAVVEA